MLTLDQKVEIRPLYDLESGTWTYLVIERETKQAILIDPVIENLERDINLINELNLTLVYTMETHMHADHVTSAGKMRTRLKSESLVPESAGIQCASNILTNDSILTLGDIHIKVIQTPGHTPCSTSYLLNNSHIFTGDTLLIRGCGRTDFQGGSADELYDSVTNKIFTLDDHISVLPGHDYKGMVTSTIGEEKKFNPRIANKTKSEFINIMNSLNLPKPKKIDFAVIANQSCGETL
ncbi:MAG: MBL fold metallo-hydrolase [Leptospira sp.]|nr:MBL fold metallo-hydrolase [Leptospira sp.]